MATTTVRSNPVRSGRPSSTGAVKRRPAPNAISKPHAPARARAKAKPLASPCERVLPIGLLLGALYLGVAARLVDLQVVRHRDLTAQAENLHQKSLPIAARRGVLLDRNGTLLVRNEPAYAIDVDPNAWFVNNNPKLPSDSPDARRENTMTMLAGFLPDVDMAKWTNAPLTKGKSGRFRTLAIASPIPIAVGNDIKAAKLAGVAVRSITKRVALNGTLAPHVVGFTGRDGDGLNGLENGLNEPLTGKEGKLQAEFDHKRQPIPGTVRSETPAKNGQDVVLTLDAPLQQVVQEKLAAACALYKAEAGTVVVLDVKTGDILAIANCPTFDVNNHQAVPIAALSNRAVSSPFEPGSTLKMITVAAALEEKAVTMDQTFYCGGSRAIGRRTIHCALHHPYESGHGSEQLLDVIKNSCNVATAECAFRLGKDKLAKYEHAFGLAAKTGAGLPGESRGQMSDPSKWSDIQLANVGFGQGISVTALQLAAAFNVVANDGVYQSPRIVWGQEENDVLKPAKPAPGRRVVSVETAREMRKMLQAVVDSGTGGKAQLTGYTAGGKTGTAQIAENKSYANGKFVASFVGMAPMTNPQFVIAVSLTDPKGNHFGGQVSAPVFKEIAEYALLARRVPHDKSIVRPKNSGVNAALSND